jgi:hypothetical protein
MGGGSVSFGIFHSVLCQRIQFFAGAEPGSDSVAEDWD